jgi:hypothetical protein
LTFGLFFIPFLIIFRIVNAITNSFFISLFFGMAPYVYLVSYLYDRFIF